MERKRSSHFWPNLSTESDTCSLLILSKILQDSIQYKNHYGKALIQAVLSDLPGNDLLHISKCEKKAKNLVVKEAGIFSVANRSKIQTLLENTE